MERILVVDDEAHVVRLLQRFLTMKGYTVDTAEDGLEALAKVKAMKPQIVLLDIIMPGIGGIETMKKIKMIDPATVVIMVTAVIDEELVKRTLQLGADDYIVKPVDLNYLETFLLFKSVQIQALNS
jgi:DNA-binding response OmpR family regulator